MKKSLGDWGWELVLDGLEGLGCVGQLARPVGD